MVKDHTYYFHAVLKVNGFSENITVISDVAGVQEITPRPVCPNNVWTNWDVLFTRTGATSSGNPFLFYFDSAYTDDTKELYLKEFSCFDLTQMFGSGNEPTLEECKKIFSADYYPYDAGTIRSFPVRTVRSLNAEGTEIGSMDVSSFTSNFKSAGPAHDEWSNGKVTKRITTVDISNLIFFRDGDKNYWYTSDIPLGLGASRACISNKLSYGGRSSLGYTDRTKWYLSSAGFFELYDDTATSPQEVKNNYADTILQFELDSPTEETVPEIDNYIKVEGGGTLTFESDDTVHMSVPSTDRFIVDLTSTTEETT